MGLDDLLISTGVDQLIRLMKERGRMEIGMAAKELHLPMRTVEDWSHVLEEEGLIAIEYKLTKIYLVWKAPTAEYVAQKAGKLEEKAVEAKGNVAVLLSKVQKGGAELEGMEAELSRLKSAPPLTPSDVKRLKSELAELEEKYNASITSSSERLEKLKKKAAALGPRIGADGGKKKGGEVDLQREVALLRKFEETLSAQLEDNETFFGAFEARVEDFRSRIEGSKKDEALEGIRAELAEISSLKGELTGALEAVAEEQKSIADRISKLDRRMEEIGGKEDSLEGAKKKLAELRRMEEDAKKQKGAVAAQLSDTLSLVKKQLAKVEEYSSKQSQTQKSMDALKEEYVDIEEGLSHAAEELAEKQKEISARIAAQMGSLDSVRGGASKVSTDEIEKVSFLIRELKREQALLEEKVRLLVKESEIIRMEAGAVPEQAAAARSAVRVPAAPSAGEGAQPEAFVEKIKLSAEEETEFAHKRDELRSLIQKMWEENKGGSAPS